MAKFSALELLDDNALYKFTYLLTYLLTYLPPHPLVIQKPTKGT